MDEWTLSGDANSLAAEFELFYHRNFLSDDWSHYFADIKRTRDNVAWVNFVIRVGWPPPDLQSFALIGLRTLPISQETKITLQWIEPSEPVMGEPCYSREEIREFVNQFASKQSLVQKNGLPPVEDPTDQRILEWVTNDPDLTDTEIGQRLGISRQAVNTRRRRIETMGYIVR